MQIETVFLSAFLAFSTLVHAASDSVEDKRGGECAKRLSVAPSDKRTRLTELVNEMKLKDQQLFSLKRDNKGMSGKGQRLRKRLQSLVYEIEKLDPGFQFDEKLELAREANGASMIGLSQSDEGWFASWNPFNLMAGESQKRELAKAEAHEAHKARLRGEIQALLNASGDLAAHVLDFLQVTWLKHEIDRDSVALLVGAEQGPESELAAGVEKLTQAGFAVVYDADAQTAPLIAQAAGARGIGIASGGRLAHSLPPESTVLTIRNPYLRLKAFTLAERSVTTHDSPIGLALRVQGRLHYSLGWPDRLSGEFSDWAAAARPNLNLRASGLINGFSSALHLAEYMKLNFRGQARREFKFDLESVMADARSDNLASLLESSRMLSAAEAQMRSMQAPAGVAFFGSGLGHSAYERLVYLAARALGERGITVVTGGSGGFMELANRGAFDGGAQSIGIPITAGSTPKNEERVAHEFHTLTVPALNYETRIPLLLYQREAAIMAPGGSGTMKELAVTLASGKRIILLGEYYRPLFKWFHATALPEEVKSRISICLSVEELKVHLDRLAAELGDGVGNLQPQAPPPPRHEIPRRFGGPGQEEKPSKPASEFEPPPASFLSPPVQASAPSPSLETQDHFLPVVPDDAKAPAFELLARPVTQLLWYRVATRLRGRWIQYADLPVVFPSPRHDLPALGIHLRVIATWIDGLNHLSEAGDNILDTLFEAHRYGDRFRHVTSAEMRHAAAKFSDLNTGFRLVRVGKAAP